MLNIHLGIGQQVVYRLGKNKTERPYVGAHGGRVAQVHKLNCLGTINPVGK